MFCAFVPAIAVRSIFLHRKRFAQPLGVIRTLYEEMFPGVDFSEYLRQRDEMDAISYLFRVTSGIWSHGAGRGPDFRTGQGCI